MKVYVLWSCEDYGECTYISSVTANLAEAEEWEAQEDSRKAYYYSDFELD